LYSVTSVVERRIELIRQTRCGVGVAEQSMKPYDDVDAHGP